MSKYIIIKDTREQNGWHFEAEGLCKGMIVDTLKTGDYCIQGLEKKLLIERKASVNEIAGNLCQERFYKELERTREFDKTYLICEFSVVDLCNYPHGCGLPSYVIKKIQVTGNFLLKKINEIQLDYNINVCFCSNKNYAEIFVKDLFKRVYERSQH